MERPEDVARIRYAPRSGEGEHGYWYFETKLEARVVMDRLLDDDTLDAGMEVKREGGWRRED